MITDHCCHSLIFIFNQANAKRCHSLFRKRGDALDNWHHLMCLNQFQVGAAVLAGLDRATRRYKSTWSPTTDNREFTRY